MICVQYSLTYIPFVNPVLITRMLSYLEDYSVRLTEVLIVHFHVLSIATDSIYFSNMNMGSKKHF